MMNIPLKTIRVYTFDINRINQDGTWQKIILYTVTANPKDIKKFIDNLSPNQYYEFVED